MNMKRLLVISLLLNAVLLGYGAWRLSDGPDPPAPPEADWLWTARVSLFESLPPADGGDVFLGASIIQYGAWQELLEGIEPNGVGAVRRSTAGDGRGDGRPRHNRGIRGDTSAGVLARLEPSVKGRPERVFVMVGLNDLSRGVPVEELLANHAAIVETLREQTPEIRVLIFSLLPVRRPGAAGVALNELIVEANAGLAALAERADCTYLDAHATMLGEDGQLRPELTTDGVHLNGQGYALLRIAAACAPR